MALSKGHNPNRPRKGSAIKVDPIRDVAAIARIKQNLLTAKQYRNHCLFTLGINTAWRANELLSLRVRHVQYLRVGDLLELKQSKTARYRKTPVNASALRAIELWLAHHKSPHPSAPLFLSAQGGALGVPALWGLVKKWCHEAGAVGHFGSHSLRKTWGYQQRVMYGVPVSLISQAFGHSSERETLRYIGILPCEVSALYRNEI